LIIDYLKKLRNFILASASPRRRDLLIEAGYEFTVVQPEIDESAFPATALVSAKARRAVAGRSAPYGAGVTSEGTGACKYAEQLALAKARDVAGEFPDCLVIGADTVVDFQGEIIGKAANEKEAEVITRKLFSAPHKVITGVAVVRMADGVEIVESETTTVYPKVLTDKQIAEHIKGGTWRGKAGAYAIQESGDVFIERIEGSLTNVMGLPMELLGRMLKQIVDF
jgi:septum formation protein